MMINLLLFMVVTAAAVSDLRTRRIPNQLVAAGLTAALMLQAFAPNTHFIDGIEGMALGLALLIPFYALKGMGAGDVKLMAVIGAFVGPAAVLRIVLATFVAGGLLCAGYWLSTRRVRAAADGPGETVYVPYAVAIAAGTLAGWNWTGALGG